MSRTAAELARAAADAMWAEDHASRGLGFTLDRVEPGFAVVATTVTERMVNGLGICHGGFIFTLADTAMAFASNSHNQRSVAQGCQIAFIAPARQGMRLEAEARERNRGERNAIYDVTVRSDTGEVIAEFRGNTRSIAGKLVPDG